MTTVLNVLIIALQVYLLVLLARIVVARALEDEGVIAPANDNLRPPR